MRRTFRILVIVLLLALLSSGIDLWQERPRPSPPPPPDGHDRSAGAIHVHSLYSDGGGTIQDIRDAARRAGLDFVIITDHSTTPPLFDRPRGTIDRALVLMGEEVNTSAGHLLALGVDRHIHQRGPAGLQAVIDTIRTAGGLGIVAHPDGRRPWLDWSVARLQGLEILNADSEWRNDNPFELIRALVWYSVFPDASFNSLMDRPEAVLRRWDALSRQGRVVGIGGVDAHARLPLWGNRFLPFPSYERLFRLLRTYVITSRPLTGSATTDRATILDALRAGHCYIAVDGYERASRFTFEATNGGTTAGMGDSLTYRPGSRLRIRAGSSGRVLIRLVRDGVTAAETRADEMSYPVTAPGVYRAEVYQLRRRLPLWRETPRPWVFSNPIWVVQGL